LGPTEQRYGKRGACRPGNWSGRVLLAWMVVLVLSCTGTIEQSRVEEETPVEQEVQEEMLSSCDQEFRLAMAKLETGDLEGTREILTPVAERDEDKEMAARAEFALGVIQLLEIEDLARMKAARDYFEAYSNHHPDGPYLGHSDRIVLILDREIKRANEEQHKIRQLTEQLKDQEKVIQTLQYKIEKLEEIFKETESKRHLPETE
jgi:hypothetical protein